MTRLLTRVGYRVTTASSVAAAREAAAHARFDLVVSDVGLPDGTGIELMETLHAEHGLRGITLTGYGVGMSVLLICAVSERLPFRRVSVPGVAFLASIAYSVYLSHKLAIHIVISLCAWRSLALTSAAAIGMNLAVVLLVGTALFFGVERPFLRLRRRSTPSPIAISATLGPANLAVPSFRPGHCTTDAE